MSAPSLPPTPAKLRPWALASLVVWMTVVGLGLWFTPRPPEAPAVTDDEESIRARLNAWAIRDAKRWAAERGDHVIEWDQADGHLAVVIDDVGRELVWFERLLALRWRLTFAVLPGSAYAAGSQLRLAEDHRRYREVILHLPTEPLDAAAMRAGPERQEVFLRREHEPAALRLELVHALSRVPTAVGVNNHMGSAFTADPEAMAAIMPVLAKRGLFWLDSRTTAETVAVEQAEAVGVPVVSRQVFLDHDPDPAAIEAAMRDAIARSKTEPVVVIGHPSTAVVEVLGRTLSDAHAEGVGVYPLSEFVVRSQRRAALSAPEEEP